MFVFFNSQFGAEFVEESNLEDPEDNVEDVEEEIVEIVEQEEYQ